MYKYELHPDVKNLLEEHPAFCCDKKRCQHNEDWWLRLSYMYSKRVKGAGLEFTYIVHIGGDFYKIGTSWNIEARLRSFQMSNPFISGIDSIVAAIPHGRVTAGQLYEKALHEFCGEKGWALDSNGEVFKMLPKEVKTLLDHAVSLSDKITKIKGLNESKEDFKKRKKGKTYPPALSRSELIHLIHNVEKPGMGSAKMLERNYLPRVIKSKETLLSERNAKEWERFCNKREKEEAQLSEIIEMEQRIRTLQGALRNS